MLKYSFNNGKRKLFMNYANDLSNMGKPCTIKSLYKLPNLCFNLILIPETHSTVQYNENEQYLQNNSWFL